MFVGSWFSSYKPSKRYIFFKILFLLPTIFYSSLLFSNEVEQLIASYSTEQRHSTFSEILNVSNNECGNVVYDYFQGIIQTKLFWSVKCSNGNEWSLRFPEKLDEKIEIRNCNYFGQKGLECFSVLTEGVEPNQMDVDSCSEKKHEFSNKAEIIDRCKIISVKNSNFFIDKTSAHLEAFNKFSISRDEGIILLLYFQSKRGGSPSCSFRQLRYFPNEQGYKLSTKELSNALIDKKIKVTSKDQANNLLQAGQQAPINLLSLPDEYEILTSHRLNINNYDAWDSTFEMWSSEDSSAYGIGRKYFTRVIQLPQSLRKGDAKYFITAECGYLTTRINISNRDFFIKNLIDSIVILQ